MMLKINNLKFAYNNTKPVLKGINLELEDGKISVVLGKNGAGKTTLFKCILGFVKPDGEILFDGDDIANMSRTNRAKLIGYVPQELAFGSLTVYETIMVGRLSHFGTFASVEDKEVVSRVMDELEISHLADDIVSNLSGGERQKVAIARALAQDPKLLIFDEPTGNLDIQNEQLIFDVVKKIASERKIAILIAIHNLSFPLNFGDRFFLMKDGIIKYTTDKTSINEEKLNDIYGVKAKIYDLDGTKVITVGGIK